MLYPLLLPDAIAVLACAIAVVTDGRRYRIPNWLTASSAIAGLASNTGVAWWASGSLAGAWSLGLAPSLIGCFFLLAPFTLAGTFGMMGMGDAKLMGAVGACMRWPFALPVLVYTSLAGGILALVIAVRRGRLKTTLRNLTKGDKADTVRRIPYGVAIFVGVSWTVLAKLVPSLRIL